MRWTNYWTEHRVSVLSRHEAFQEVMFTLWYIVTFNDLLEQEMEFIFCSDDNSTVTNYWTEHRASVLLCQDPC